jgi:succinoglycan biosynthesis protein ExoM
LSADAPDVSVCIATCRRPQGLARLLESLARQDLPEGVAVEVIVVDNDPQGSAAEALRPWRDGPHALRLLREPRPNVAHVRNRAVEAARGTWLAFIDDDEVADEGWLAAYWIRRDARDGWFGPVLPRLERNVTPWLDLEGFYARPRHASGASIAASDARTGNAFVRRDLFATQAFDPAYGDPAAHAEDHVLFARLLADGADFGWCDEAIVTEIVPPANHRLGWLARRAFNGGVVSARLAAPSARGLRIARGTARTLLGLAFAAASLPVAALRGRCAGARLWLRACVQAGHLRVLWGRGS